MKPAFSTVTFGSCYTLATGLYQESHGIVGNSFFDPETNRSFSKMSHDAAFFKGEPIWVTAKRQGKKTAVINWIGGQVDWGANSPDIAPSFSNDVSLRERLDQVIDYLQNQKMDLVMLYFNQPDRAGHTYGALSNEVLQELEIIDRDFDRLFDIMEKHEMNEHVNTIILSDHGMMNLTSDNPYIVIQVDDWELAKNTDHIEVSDVVAHFYLKEGEEREKIVMNHLSNLLTSRGHFNVYAKRDIPDKWHYRDSQRIAPVIVVADPGYYLIAHKVGDHVCFFIFFHYFDILTLVSILLFDQERDKISLPYLSPSTLMQAFSFCPFSWYQTLSNGIERYQTLLSPPLLLLLFPS